MPDDDDEKRNILRSAIGPHTARWAEDKGLLMLLNSLESSWPHLFALPAAALEGKDRPWVAKDESDSSLEKAYKKATLHLHPDRLVSQNRDLSVRVEAEEVFKQLQTAYSHRRWVLRRRRPLQHARYSRTAALVSAARAPHS